MSDSSDQSGRPARGNNTPAGRASQGRPNERRPKRPSSSAGYSSPRARGGSGSALGGRGDREPGGRDGQGRSARGFRSATERADFRPARSGNARTSQDRDRADFRGRGERRGRRDGELTREQVREQERALRPGLERKANEPATPEEVDLRELPRAVRAELRSLPQDLATIVGAHLVAAGALIEEDPEQALAHAQAARRRAARLPVVREATAETAYAAGDWSTALTEYRALHRMTGDASYLPVMADCERALGRPRDALSLARKAAAAGLDPANWLEMVMVEAGARADLGQRAEGMRVLRQAISSRRGPKESQARLRYALADLAEAEGDHKLAVEMFTAADRLDVEHLLDADERLVALGGVSTRAADDGVHVVDYGEPGAPDGTAADAETNDSPTEEDV